MVEPRLLLLRLWSGQTPFRAVVREFDPECSRHFDDPQRLIEFVLGTAPPDPVPRSTHQPEDKPDIRRRSKK